MVNCDHLALMVPWNLADGDSDAYEMVDYAYRNEPYSVAVAIVALGVLVVVEVVDEGAEADDVELVAG